MKKAAGAQHECTDQREELREGRDKARKQVKMHDTCACKDTTLKACYTICGVSITSESGLAEACMTLLRTHAQPQLG